MKDLFLTVLRTIMSIVFGLAILSCVAITVFLVILASQGQLDTISLILLELMDFLVIAILVSAVFTLW